MKISENALNLLVARSVKGAGRKWINDNLVGVCSDEGVVARLSAKLAPSLTVAQFRAFRESLRQRIVASLGGYIDGVVGAGDADFPKISDGVRASDRPIALFYRGNLSLLANCSRNVAVIGVLNPTEAVVAEETNVVKRLVEGGNCIVSGLALGCDTVGHRTALCGGGKTIAFLPGPLSDVNPPSNRPLAEEIVRTGGLLVSEYGEAARSRQEFLGRYAERDRLQAMFVRCVVLAASYAPNNAVGGDSGSRFAMSKAIEYGIPRMVIYDKAHADDDLMYELNRMAIREGATIINPNNLTTLRLPECRPTLRQGSLF